MSTHTTVETSLKFDPDIRTHETRKAAVEYAVRRLVAEGWSRDEALAVVEAGKPALFADDGNDWTIVVQDDAAAVQRMFTRAVERFRREG